MRSLLFSLLIAFLVSGCSLWPSPPQGAIARSGNIHYAYQVPGHWESKEDDWYEGRQLRLRLHEGSTDARARRAEKLEEAVVILDVQGPSVAAGYVARLSPLRFDRAQEDAAELEALSQKVQQALELLPGTAYEKPDPQHTAKARELLEQAQVGYADGAGDREKRCRRLFRELLGRKYQVDTAQPLKVDGQPAMVLTGSASSSKKDGKDHVGFLVFEVQKDKLASLAFFDDRTVDQETIQAVAASIRIGVEAPRKAPKTKERRELPAGLSLKSWIKIIILAVVSLLAAFGAATGYSPMASAEHRAANAASGAFFYSGAGMLLSTAGLALILISEIGNGPTSGGGAMVGVGWLIFGSVYLAAATVACAVTAGLASFGARQGARGGRLSAALGAAFSAGLGALVVPALMGWLR